VLEKAEYRYSAFESTLNSAIVSYRKSATSPPEHGGKD